MSETIDTFIPQEQEEVMQITTSWMRKGIEQGIEQGAQREKELILRQLKRKLGEIDSDLEAQIRALNLDRLEELGEAFLDFSTVAEVRDWLNN